MLSRAASMNFGKATIRHAFKYTMGTASPKKAMFNKPRVIVTGGTSGRLGPEISAELTARGYEVVPTTSNPKSPNYLDLSDQNSIAERIDVLNPVAIVHQAALSSGGYAKMHKVNVEGTDNIVKAANLHGTPAVYVSTVAADLPGLEELGEARVPYALSKKRALAGAQESNDITILSAGALVGPADGSTPAIPDLAGVKGLVRVKLDSGEADAKPRVFQPTTYRAVAKGVGNILTDISNNPDREKGVKKIAAVGDAVRLNDFIEGVNPSALLEVTLGDLEGLRAFTEEHNDGVASSEFLDLDSLDQGKPLDTTPFKELIKDDYPSAKEVQHAARDGISVPRTARVNASMAKTVLNKGSLEMVRGVLKVIKYSSLAMATAPQYLPQEVEV